MRKIFFSVLFLILVTAVTTVTVSAKTDNPEANPNGQIPEISGDYAVEGKPNLRVRVFVHKEKDTKEAGKAKPGPVPTSTPVPCSDVDSLSTVGATEWHLPNGNISYFVNKSSAPTTILKDNIVGISAKGFTSWTGSIQNLLKPNPVYAGTTLKNRAVYDGVNIVSWGSTQSTTLGVTYTWYYPDTGIAVETDTILNNRINWSLGACYPNSYDAEDILVHELGHWYGLDDHYTTGFIDNTMYGYGSKAETKKITPATGDIAGLNLIYLP